MRKLLKSLLIAALPALFMPVMAKAATTNFSIVFNTPASTGVTCSPGGPFTLPVAAGTQVAACSVAPSTWGGTLALSGTGAANFSIGGSAPNFTVNIASGVTYNTAGTVTLTATSTP